VPGADGSERAEPDEQVVRHVVAAAGLIGVGLGGFFDGIVFHQLLQWHHMLSSRLPTTDLVRLKANMVWDGVFHAFTWAITLVGVLWLWHTAARTDARGTGRAFEGALLRGWGLFNLVEGVIDHQILGLHHVHPGSGQAGWDLAFLVSGVALIVGGSVLLRASRADRR